MSKSSGVERWESAEFPMVCEGCLGTNPYIRMIKEVIGAECKICEKPFTKFRWQPSGSKGVRTKFKVTEICSVCAKIQSVCQTCLLDIRTGLPVAVRDSILNKDASNKLVLHENRVNREYYLAANADKIEQGSMNTALLDANIAKEVDPEGFITLEKVTQETGSRTMKAVDRRNAPNLCTFYAKGLCNRGDSCPYEHSLPTEGSSTSNSFKSFRDRYYGTNDDKHAKRIMDSSNYNITKLKRLVSDEHLEEKSKNDLSSSTKQKTEQND